MGNTTLVETCKATYFSTLSPISSAQSDLKRKIIFTAEGEKHPRKQSGIVFNSDCVEM